MRPIMLCFVITTLMVLALPSFAEEAPPQPVTVSAEAVATPVAVSKTPAWDNARQWIVAFIGKQAPPGRPTYFTHAKETKEEAEARHLAIADDLIDVVYHPDTKPIFSGERGRSKTVSLILGIMLWETGFRKDVDYGLGPYARGDQGKSWCLMQLNIGTGRTPAWNLAENRPATDTDPEQDVHPGYLGTELVSERTACIGEGLKVVRRSFNSCRTLPLDLRLSAYASGSCSKGQDKSRQRVGTGMRWYTNSRDLRTFKDIDLVQEVFAKHNPPPAPKKPKSDKVAGVDMPTILAKNP